MKRIGSALAILVLAACDGDGPSAAGGVDPKTPSPDPYETNDAAGSAWPLPFGAARHSLSASLGYDGDEDWYRLELHAEMEVDVEFTYEPRVTNPYSPGWGWGGLEADLLDPDLARLNVATVSHYTFRAVRSGPHYVRVSTTHPIQDLNFADYTLSLVVRLPL